MPSNREMAEPAVRDPRTGAAGARGFSLIELLIVVVILGLLVGIALPMYGDYLQTGRQGAAMTQMRAISDANELYRVRHGAYAPKVADLVPDYMRQIPLDPWGISFSYETTGSGFVIRSLGSDSAPGPPAPPGWLDEPYEADIVLDTGVFTQAPGHAAEQQ